jgi:hypothetical protein
MKKTEAKKSRATVPLKVPKHENLGNCFFTPSNPILFRDIGIWKTNNLYFDLNLSWRFIDVIFTSCMLNLRRLRILLWPGLWIFDSYFFYFIILPSLHMVFANMWNFAYAHLLSPCWAYRQWEYAYTEHTRIENMHMMSIGVVTIFIYW